MFRTHDPDSANGAHCTRAADCPGCIAERLEEGEISYQKAAAAADLVRDRDAVQELLDNADRYALDGDRAALLRRAREQHAKLRAVLVGDLISKRRAAVLAFERGEVDSLPVASELPREP